MKNITKVKRAKREVKMTREMWFPFIVGEGDGVEDEPRGLVLRTMAAMRRPRVYDV